MKAYLPTKFLQVALHQQGGDPPRLGRFSALLSDLDFDPIIGVELLEIDTPGLLILPTRQCRFKFSTHEINFVQDYVSQGYPLFHLSNHPPLNIEDSRVGRRFGYTFVDVVKGISPQCNFDVFPLSNTRSIFVSLDRDPHFTIRNSSMVTFNIDGFFPIADFTRSRISCGKADAAFAIARPRVDTYGAIVVLGDSGLLGEPMAGNPGPGLGAGNNRDLVGCILQWLRNQTA